MNGPRTRAAALALHDVTVELSGRRIVEEVGLVAHGEVVGLVGPNGSGKSTVLRTVYRALRPTSGVVSAAGRDVWRTDARRAARTTAAVVQEGPGGLDLTVGEYVATGRVPHGRLLAGDTEQDRLAVEQALQATGLGELTGRRVDTLSGGERQHAHLARALAQRPSILVLDEPTNHLDVRHQLDLLARVRGLGVTVLITLHDLNLAAASCDRVVVLHRGRVVGAGNPAEVLTPALLREVFDVEAVCSTNPLTGRPSLAFGLGAGTGDSHAT